VTRLARILLVLAVPAAATVAVSLPSYAAGTPSNTAAPACRSAALDRTTSTDQASYARGAPVGISTSVLNASRHPCTVDIRACVSATVTNASGTIVWSAVPFNALCAQHVVHQRLAPGQAVTRSWTWDQHVCIAIGQCPGPQVPAGRYVAEGHWGGGIGDAQPTAFRIRR
jgi:hypothetical protein